MPALRRLKEILHYDPITGHFTWRTPRPKIHVGQRAGSCHHRGRRHIEIEGTPYAEHRLAWAFMTGRWPRKQVDHRNRIRDDNRFINLRLATNGQNRANSKTSNKHGVKGVRYAAHLKEKPWVAQITYRKRVRYLGCYSTKEAAHQAYCEEAKRLHGEFFNPV